MTFKLDSSEVKSDMLPAFSISVDYPNITTIYSDTDFQTELIKLCQKSNYSMIFDQREGLYERLSVEGNVAFYHKWFGCKTPLPEILVEFKLHNCAKKPVRKCTLSEIRRIYYAKYYMMNKKWSIFREPIQGVDVLTVHTFINMLHLLKKKKMPVLILITNLEHALLLGDIAYRLQEKGLHQIEMEMEEKKDPEIEASTSPSITNLFKISAKVGDKVILFDPPEIDYIESQDGKSHIVIDNESFTMDATLAEVEKKLVVYGFFRCHRSYIVNLQKVREIITWSKNTYSLRIDNKSQATIPLSRTKIQDIQKIFSLK